MYPSDGVRWFSKLRDDKNDEKKAPSGLLSFRSSALEKDYILSRERLSQDHKDTYYNYAAFDSHWDVFHFLKKEPQWRRQYHEVIPEFREQKPRFDIDVDIEKYRLAKKADPEIRKMSLGEVGDLVKDMVLEAAKKVMKKHDIDLDFNADIMVFTSHGKEKRSYHIILNRYFHSCCAQAYAFYIECKRVCLYPELFELLVDPGIYTKNHSIRLLWCNKLSDLSRVKKYTPEFTYHGRKYRHIITQYFEGYEDQNYDEELTKLIVFGNSLVTFTAECSPMPKFPVKTKKYVDTEEIDDDTFEKCKAIVDKWDKDNVFEVLEAEKGRIMMKRLVPSYCDICKRVHDKRNPFCYILNGGLYWHCVQGKGKPGICLGRIPGKMSRVEMRICQIFELKKATITDENGVVIYDDDVTAPTKSKEATFDDAEFEVGGKSVAIDSFFEDIPAAKIQKAVLPSFISKYIDVDRKALNREYDDRKTNKPTKKRLSDSSSSESSSSSEESPRPKRRTAADIRNPVYTYKSLVPPVKEEKKEKKEVVEEKDRRLKSLRK